MEAHSQFRFSRTFLLLGFVGLLLSLYLLYHHTAITFGYQINSSFCSLSETIDCDAVAQSSYSEVGGVPVAALGALFYLIVIGFAAFPRSSERFTQQHFGSAAHALAVIGLIPTLILAAISGFVLKKVCILCFGLYVVNVVLTLIGWKAAKPAGGAKAGISLISEYLSAATAPADHRRLPALLTVAAVIFAFLALWFVPPFLVVRIFAPQEQATARESTAEKIVEMWEKASPSAIEVVSSSDLFERDFQLGAPDSPIEVIAFSDFECPHCQKAAMALHELVTEYPIRIVFKNFPLDNACNPLIDREFHKFACEAARFTRCAGAQGEDRFWAMHDALFSQTGLSTELMTELSSNEVLTELGIEGDSFRACLNEPQRIDTRLQKDIDVAKRLQIQSTPSIFVNKRMVKFPTAEVLRAVIERAAQDLAPAAK